MNTCGEDLAYNTEGSGWKGLLISEMTRVDYETNKVTFNREK